MINESDDRLTQLYQQLEKAAPSEMLDARIKKAAHGKMRTRKQTVAVRWLSVAAVIVLSVGVVLRVVQEQPVEQDLRNKLDEVQTSESDAVFEAEKSMMDMLPEKAGMTKDKRPEQKVQQAAVVQRNKVQKSRDVMGAMAPEIKKQELLDIQSSEMKLAKPAASAIVNWCGQDDLADSKDRLKWDERLELLKLENRLEQVECLQTLMQEMFLQDEE